VTNFLIISIAAVLGANARYFLNRLTAHEVGAFPYGTLLINVVGSLIAGFFIIWSSERILLDPRWRLLVVVGFCGSFTTFSGYAIESIGLINQGQWPMMLTNVLGNNFLCLGAAFAGMALARVL
jgi:fluoride exporter